MTVTPEALISSADEIDNRMGPIPGRSSDRIAKELRSAAEILRGSLTPGNAGVVEAKPTASETLSQNLERYARDCVHIGSVESINDLYNAAAIIRDYMASPAAPEPAPDAVREAGFIKPDNDRQVFFYEQDFYVLSNFSAFTLDWQGWRFDTSEAAYHWEKFAHMNEVGIVGGHECHQCYVIRRAPSAHAAFKIAEANKAARRADWDTVKVGIMRDILRAKVNQHEYVRRKLIATGDRELIEDSWRDDYWGWGPNRDGQNMLGKLWMAVRAELRAATLPPDAGRRG
jgi:ribA/ribD-fused uncharacterized protein